ncbi:MAG: DUF4339 domain-containing protein [Acidobacteriota bacterium]
MSLTDLPAPDVETVYVHVDGERQGPMSRRVLFESIRAGRFDTSALFWLPSLGDEWARIGDHPDLVADLRPAIADAPAELPTELPPFSDPETRPAGAGAAPEVEATAEGTAVTAAVASQPRPAATVSTEDDRLDGIFSSLVEESWDYLQEHRFASHIDEVFLGAVITSTLDAGYSLIDLSSDGANHYLRFENLADGSRVIVRLRHLTGDLAAAKVLGQKASAVVGYGEKMPNASTVVSALKAELKSGFMGSSEPGSIAVDGDLASGYVYAQVDLFLRIDDYIQPDYATDHAKLAEHLASCVHALRKYLRGRFAQ